MQESNEGRENLPVGLRIQEKYVCKWKEFGLDTVAHAFKHLEGRRISANLVHSETLS